MAFHNPGTNHPRSPHVTTSPHCSHSEFSTSGTGLGPVSEAAEAGGPVSTRRRHRHHGAGAGRTAVARAGAAGDCGKPRRRRRLHRHDGSQPRGAGRADAGRGHLVHPWREPGGVRQAAVRPHQGFCGRDRAGQGAGRRGGQRRHAGADLCRTHRLPQGESGQGELCLAGQRHHRPHVGRAVQEHHQYLHGPHSLPRLRPRTQRRGGRPGAGLFRPGGVVLAFHPVRQAARDRGVLEQAPRRAAGHADLRRTLAVFQQRPVLVRPGRARRHAGCRREPHPAVGGQGAAGTCRAGAVGGAGPVRLRHPAGRVRRPDQKGNRQDAADCEVRQNFAGLSTAPMHPADVLRIRPRGRPPVLAGTMKAMTSPVRYLPGATALVLDSPHSGTRYPMYSALI
eukprot:Opistho-1_new@70579